MKASVIFIIVLVDCESAVLLLIEQVIYPLLMAVYSFSVFRIIVQKLPILFIHLRIILSLLFLGAFIFVIL